MKTEVLLILVPRAADHAGIAVDGDAKSEYVGN